MIDIDALLARNDGLILARDHRHLKSSLSRWVKRGLLTRLMRGVYAHPARRLADRIRAVEARIPGGVIADASALALALHADPTVEVIDVCTPTRRLPQKGYRFTHRPIPREFVARGVMSPTLAAVDLADSDPQWLDELVRRHIAAPWHLRQTLDEFPHRRGNRLRQTRVARTATRPWSPAERRYHDLFDERHITGWVANETVRVDGVGYAPDMAFKPERLAVEVDGRQFHTDRMAFESDRRRSDELVKAGWTILRFTWNMLDDPDWVVDTVRTVRARLRHERGLAPIRVRRQG